MHLPHLRSLTLALLLAVASPAGAEEEPWQYTLGPGDVVGVNVQAGADKHELELGVAGDGTIDVVGAGRLKVQGLTTPQVGSMIERKLRERGIYTAPSVAVNVKEYLSQCVNVSGLVKNQGRFCLRRQTRLLDILAEAGGVEDAEAGDVIRIMRKDAAEPILVERAVLVGADIEKARAANIFVQADDNVHVPRKEVPEIVQFCITGAVVKPDCYDHDREFTLKEAIAKAGGLDLEKTDGRKITVVRKTATGDVRHELNLDRPGADGAAFQVRSGDEITVQETPPVVWVSGSVKEGGQVSWYEGLLLTDALSAVGLSDDKGMIGNLKKVRVRRTDGTTEIVDARAMMEGKRKDMPLRPDDRIFVPQRSW